jgi:hypothetical protein
MFLVFIMGKRFLSHALPKSCVLILASVHMGTVFGQEKNVTLVPEQMVQSSLADAMACEKWHELCPPLTRLVEITGMRADRLVPQLLFYTTRVEQGGSDERMKRLASFRQLVQRLEIPVPHVAAALVPYLDSPDVEVRGTVEKLLNGYEDRSAARPPNFSIYQGILESSFRQPQDPPAPLVMHMYEVDPSAALLTLVRSTPRKTQDDERAILLAEHSVSDVLWRLQHNFIDVAQAQAAAAAHLRSLSHSRLWWVRCYSAYTMKSHPPLRIEEIVKLLRNDPHNAVAGAVQFATDR